MRTLAARARLAGLLALLLACLGAPLSAVAAETAPPPAAEAPAPEEVRRLLELLRDPGVRDWIGRAAEATTAPGEGPPAEGTGADAGGAHAYLAQRLAFFRANLRQLAEAAPRIPAELARAAAVVGPEMRAQGPGRAVLLIAAFAGLGFGVQGLFWRLSARWRRRIVGSPLDTVDERLSTVFQRLLYGVLMAGSFAVGSLGAFLAFPWPPLIQQVVAAALLVLLAVLVAQVVGRFLLAPGAARFRVLPLSQASAEHWFLWLRVIAGYAAAELVLFGLLRALGVSPGVVALLVLAWGFGGFLLTAIALLRRPAHRADAPGARLRTRLLLLWLGVGALARTVGAFPLFVLLLVAVGLPAALSATRRAVAHLLRRPGSESGGAEPPGFVAAGLERGLEAALVLAALWLVARTFGLGVDVLSADGSPAARLARGALNAVVILLLADLAWHLARSWIDRRLYEARAAGPAAGHPGGEDGGHVAADLSPEEARRRARLLTLLPILRNVGFVVLAVMAVLMALSALGIQIGPLLAGAGVVGVAVGFGAQTLVKDIISGMFYLLDDAFRVGEYITSGSYKGTVESFSLRSVKLRHHRGPLTTVPFGELGAVQNLSRDWVIDKIQIGVTYDTDLDKVKRIVKQISKEIMADPELAPGIIEPLKSQGVHAMGDFAIQVRLKVMTRPGEQFTVRRAVYAKLKKAFEANGIRFAVPTVMVEGGDAQGAAPAAAREAVELTRQRPAAE